MTAALIGVEDRPGWRQHSACLHLDPAIFFPERGEQVTTAKAVCRSCPVAAECLTYALDNDIKHGIWGGTSERQRRIMRAQRRRATLRTVTIAQARRRAELLAAAPQDGRRAR